MIEQEGRENYQLFRKDDSLFIQGGVMNKCYIWLLVVAVLALSSPKRRSSGEIIFPAKGLEGLPAKEIDFRTEK
jgi:hypothetical protein